MATVRIYKVAELLNTSSQEVIALLKRDHGIEVKSASSTIEEVVARQFVDRLARQRNIVVPSNASFADSGRRPSSKPVGAPAAAREERSAAGHPSDPAAASHVNMQRRRMPNRSRSKATSVEAVAQEP
jgi:hypothetical protein